jgi:peptidoglycan/LPS O-acetylase OafA/YrhL
MKNGRLAGLDGLRGLAAAGVAVHHIFYHFAAWPLTASPFAQVADWFKVSGWTLVDLFFLLSGFVFAHVYVPGDPLKSRAGFAEFWVARIARLYPLHLTMLLLVAIFASNPANTLTAFAAHLVMAQAFVNPIAGTFVKPAWSISIEMVCYLIFALAALWPRRGLVWFCVILAFTAGQYLWIFGPPGGPWAGDSLARGLFGFFLGQCLWLGRERLRRVPSWLLVVLVFAGFWLQVGDYSPLVPLTLLAWAPALLLGLRLRWLGSPVMVWLGDRSYAVYLINLPLISGAAAVVDVAALTAGQVIAAHVALLLAILLASEASFRYLEAPARRAIRSGWDKRQERIALRRAAA